MALSAEKNPGVREDERHLSPSAAIRESVKLIPSVKTAHAPVTPTASLHQRHPADAFLMSANTKALEPLEPAVSPDQSALRSPAPLISIGPNTDAILDRFRLGDELLPHLHELVGTVFFVPKPSARHVQPNPRPRIKVVLSADARTVLKLNQHEKAEQFREDLDDAWQSLDKVMKMLASKHHKSHVRFRSRKSKINAWNAFCWKKQRTVNENAAGSTRALLDLVQQNRAEYRELSAEDKDRLVAEFGQFKESKVVGIRATTKSKINDITHTLKAVENELHNLKSCTGVETMLYMTRGTTNLPLRGIAFTTDGVADFMGSVMGIDTQDLVSKMEGFAIQGIKGAAENHQQHISNTRTALRNIINCKLRDITGDPKAKMQWAQYFRNIIARYHVAIEGWPDTVVFANLSSTSSSLSQLEVLLRKWEMGSTYWKKLSDNEFRELQQERNEQLERGEIQAHSRRTRSDKGKKHTSRSLNAPSNKTYKSVAIINDNDDESADLGEDVHSPSPQLSNTQAHPVNNSSTPQTSTSNNGATGSNTNTMVSSASAEWHAAEQQAAEQQAFLDQLAEDVLTFDAISALY
ncbi:hypothetical protein EDD15DRAFT_2373070 [Pisolithus albus]|nr:hypothetical protein EDD15DRAFT_2373070 [Pisolithus albus]